MYIYICEKYQHVDVEGSHLCWSQYHSIVASNLTRPRGTFASMRSISAPRSLKKETLGSKDQTSWEILQGLGIPFFLYIYIYICIYTYVYIYMYNIYIFI